MITAFTRRCTLGAPIDAITSEAGDAACALVEALATRPREKPSDANDGVDLIVRHLDATGLPVTVYKPKLHLSAPIHAEDRAGGETFRAKPPAFCASCPDGITAPLIHLPDAGGGTPLDRNPNRPDALPEVTGKLVLIEGFALPNFTAGLKAAAARVLIPINFVRGPRFTHDPALNAPPLPTFEPTLRLAEHGPETIGFAQMALMRGQNRLVAALRDAAASFAHAGS